MPNLRICQIVPYISNEISGPSYSVPSLCTAITELNYQIILVTLFKENKTTKWPIELVQHKPGLFLSKIGWSNEANKWFKNNIKDYEIFHSNGLWMFPNVTPLKLAAKQRKKCVISPRGTVNEVALKYSKIKKFLFYNFFQKKVLKNADLIHVTSEIEYNDVRKFGLNQPVAIVPNGVDIPKIRYKKHKTIFKLIYLGRIHPKKGLENTIKAWVTVEKFFPNWTFEIAGRGEKNYEDKIKKIISDAKLKSIKYIGPLYGSVKIKFIQTADVLIMPSYNENFGMVAAEALSNNTPVICGKNTPWKGVTVKNCGWHIENDPYTLENTFIKIFKMSKSDLLDKGKKGRLWMKKEYSWQQVAKKMIQSYEWLISKKNKPDWVRL